MARMKLTLKPLAGASALAILIACSGKPPPEAAKPVQIATPPSERKAPPAPAPVAIAVEISPAEQAAASAERSADVLARFGAKMDQNSVLIRAKAALVIRIDKFREDNGRWPRSLAEAGIGRLELPPGKKVQYNAANGQATITD